MTLVKTMMIFLLTLSMFKEDALYLIRLWICKYGRIKQEHKGIEQLFYKNAKFTESLALIKGMNECWKVSYNHTLEYNFMLYYTLSYYYFNNFSWDVKVINYFSFKYIKYVRCICVYCIRYDMFCKGFALKNQHL